MTNDSIEYSFPSGSRLDFILSEISKVNENRFFYNDSLLMDMTISKEIKSNSIESVLDQAIEPFDLTFYSFKGDYFIVKKSVNEDLNDDNGAIASNDSEQKQVTVSGYVRSGLDQSPLIGVVILFDSIGVVSDTYGRYTLELPAQKYSISTSYLGWNSFRSEMTFNADTTYNIELFETATDLEEVVITSRRTDANVSDIQMSSEIMEIESIKELPTLLGEIDIYRLAQQLPGVTSVGEGSAGINVRGGNVGENLVLLNGIPMYSNSHMFGFFSTVNGDLLSNFELVKGGIKPKYGGRTSAVLSMTMKEADFYEWDAKGAINNIAARVSAGGPIKSGRSSVLIGGRISYSDYLLKSVKDPDLNESSAGFYDIGIHHSYKLNDKNKINTLGYYSVDDFAFSSDTTYKYAVALAGLKWTSILGANTSMDLSLDYSSYEMRVDGFGTSRNFDFKSGIQSGHLRTDLYHSLNTTSNLNVGLFLSRFHINPSTLSPVGNESLITPKDVTDDIANELGSYLEYNASYFGRLQLMAGLRAVMFNKEGGKEYLFESGESKEISSVIDTLIIPDGENAKRFYSLEPRFGLNYSISESSSVKLSYQRSRQFIHQLNNAVALSPFSTWRVSNTNISPQVSDQVAIGYFKNFKQNQYETSIEIYHKWNGSVIEYKNSAQIPNNEIIETELINAEGKSYGLELYVKKNYGKLRGWISYTFSRSLFMTQTPYESEILNDGGYYPSNFDKPHVLSNSITLDLSKRWSFSSNFTYSTGRPISAPTARYSLGGVRLVHFSERNQVRIPDYHRLDVSFNLKGNLKVDQKLKTSWSFGVYNLYGRKNPYTVFFGERSIRDVAFTPYQLSVIARPIPYISLNINYN